MEESGWKERNRGKALPPAEQIILRAAASSSFVSIFCSSTLCNVKWTRNQENEGNIREPTGLAHPEAYLRYLRL